MEFSRRKFFGAAAGSVVAGPAIAEQAVNMAQQAMQKAAIGRALTPIYPYPGEAQAPKPPEGWTLLNEASRKLQQKSQREIQFRITNLDPDIASFRLPRATLQRMQMRRDDELLSVFEKIQKQLSELRW